MRSLQALEAARSLVDRWIESPAQVVESLMEQRPSVAWREAEGSAASLRISPGPDVLWSPYKLLCPQDARFWIAAALETWHHMGASALKTAGLETSDPGEIKNTWSEIVAQWQSALARLLASHLGHDVTGEPSVARVPEAQNEWLLVSLRFGETELPPLAVSFAPPLLGSVTSPAAESGEAKTAVEAAEAPTAAQAGRGASPQNSDAAPASRTMDLLLELELPVSISLGKRQLPLKDVLKLTTGSIVELNRGVSEPVDILINHCLVARGEVVVVEGNYAVRIQQTASRLDRLRTIR